MPTATRKRRINPTGRRALLHQLLDQVLDRQPQLEGGVDHLLRAAAGRLSQTETISAIDLLQLGVGLYQRHTAVPKPAAYAEPEPAERLEQRFPPKTGKHIWQPVFDDTGAKYMMCAGCRRQCYPSPEAMRAMGQCDHPVEGPPP